MVFLQFNQKGVKEMQKINVGVVGCGVIGGALIKWIEENNSDKCNILKVDPPKGYNDDLANADIIFISIHIPTEEDSSQDLSLLESIIESCPEVPIFVRATLKPGTSSYLSEKYHKSVNFMPEFLTERTAYQDFCTQSMIFTNNVELLREIFLGKEYITMSSLEAEVAKYAHNVFGALKVTYFNGIYEYCQSLGIDFKSVQQGCCLSGYINTPHTNVPGPDGKLGYGGKCFPKDVKVFIQCLEGSNLHELLKNVPDINKKYRGE